jgi:hypothetical protein
MPLAGKGRIVAVIDWKAAALLKDNVRLLQRAGLPSAVRQRGRTGKVAGHRSLVVRADGSCELLRFTAATAARRLGGIVVRVSARKARTETSG